jgi:hypothetical protein
MKKSSDSITDPVTDSETPLSKSPSKKSKISKRVVNRWTEEEYIKLLKLVRAYNKNWHKIGEMLKTKTS